MFETYDIHLTPFVKLIVGHITWWSWTLEGAAHLPNQHQINYKLKLRQLKLKIGLRI